MKTIKDRSTDSFTQNSNAHTLDGMSAKELLRPLAELSSDELWRGVRSITLQIRDLTAKQVAFLAEVERRRLWEDYACSSLYDFCRRRLKMSDDGAYRRKTAAQLALRFPVVLEKLEDGGLSLSALGMLRAYLTQENHLELIEAACDKSKRQIESLIAERFPRTDIPSRMYEAPPGSSAPLLADTSRHPSGGEAPPACNDRTILQALSPGRHRIEFTGSADLRAKLEYLRDLMRHSNPKGDLAIIIERGVDLLIPNVERERFGKTNRPRKTSSKNPLDQIARGEKIPAPVRREVAERDGYQCSFESADGWRCPARSFLQFDHVIPRARNGENTVGNVCLKCGVHNRHAAKKVFGRDYIEKKIAASKDRVRLSSPSPAKPLQSNGDIVRPPLPMHSHREGPNAPESASPAHAETKVPRESITDREARRRRAIWSRTRL
jgi:hypothetical protein